MLSNIKHAMEMHPQKLERDPSLYKDWFDQRGNRRWRTFPFLSKRDEDRLSRSVPVVFSTFPGGALFSGVYQSFIPSGRIEEWGPWPPGLKNERRGRGLISRAEGGRPQQRRWESQTRRPCRAKRLFYLDPAICQTPYEASTSLLFTTPASSKRLCFLPLAPLSKGYLSSIPRPRSRNVREMDGSSGTRDRLENVLSYPRIQGFISLLSNRSRIVVESIIHGACFEA